MFNPAYVKSCIPVWLAPTLLQREVIDHRAWLHFSDQSHDSSQQLYCFYSHFFKKKWDNASKRTPISEVTEIAELGAA